MSDAFSKYQQQGLQKQTKRGVMVGVEQPASEFENELQHLINKHSLEGGSGTPDFILAEYLTGCLELFNKTVQRRANWRDESIDKIFNVSYDEKVRVAYYDTHGRKNEIGEAQLEIWPGESMAHGKIVSVIPVFANDPPAYAGLGPIVQHTQIRRDTPDADG